MKTIVRIRQELRLKMADVTERLMEVLADEADPENWSGNGVSIRKMTKEERGDRFWDKKNATATLTLLHGSLNLADRLDGFIPEREVDDILEKVARAERAATKAINGLKEKRGVH